jgi:V/A-type H+-transporting ATPase subunit E
MALSDLTEKILSDAKTDAEKIKAEATAEADSILAAARADLEVGREKLKKEAGRIAEEKYLNIVTLAKMEARNRILETKQKMVAEVFIRVRKKMESMDAPTFRKFTLNLLSRFPPSETTEVLAGRKHAGLVNDELIRELNGKIKGKAKGSFVLSSKPGSFDWGFRLFSGEMQVDLTFGSILESFRQDMETEITRILFTKG